VADKAYCLGRGLAAIRAKENRFDAAFLRHVLANGYRTFQSRGVGSTFINISKQELAAFLVPALPLPDQRRIAASLCLVEWRRGLAGMGEPSGSRDIGQLAG
jgi:type I restriction enzyme S subunit